MLLSLWLALTVAGSHCAACIAVQNELNSNQTDAAALAALDEKIKKKEETIEKNERWEVRTKECPVDEFGDGDNAA